MYSSVGRARRGAIRIRAHSPTGGLRTRSASSARHRPISSGLRRGTQSEAPPSVRAADFERHVAPLECAYVELPAPRLAPEHVVRVDGWAVCPQTQSSGERRILRLDAPWRRPGRSAHVDGVRSGDIVFLSSQLALDDDGAVVHLGDLNAQTRLCIERTRALLAHAGLGLDHMVKQTTCFFGEADPKDIVTNQTLRSSFYREPAGASTGVPLADFGVPGVLAAIDTIAMA